MKSSFRENTVAFFAFACLKISAACFLFYGCQVSDASSPFLNDCTSDRDCPKATCDRSIGTCIGTPSDEQTIQLQVIQSGERLASAPVSWTFGLNASKLENMIELSMPEAVTVVGDVRSELMHGPIPSQISFIQDANIEPGLAAHRATTSVARVSAGGVSADGNLADYTVRLAAGYSYTILVVPADDAALTVPPLVVGSMHAPEHEEVIRFNITYPSILPKLEGRVLTTQGGIKRAENSLLVRAVDVETGRVVSSTGFTARTNEKDGSFSIRLDPSVTRYAIQVSASPDRPVFPTFSVPISNESFNGEIIVPPFSTVHFTGTVEIAELDGELSHPAQHAAMTFQWKEPSDPQFTSSQRFVLSTTSDDAGRFDVNIPAGDYEIAITPSSPNEAAVSVNKLRITGNEINENSGQLFVLPLRSQLWGTVVASLRPIANAAVHALARGVWAGADALAERYNRSDETVTDSNGHFGLWLDTGVYDLLIKPPSSSGFSWTILRDVRIEASNTSDHGQIELSPPVLLRTRILTADGQGMANAEVNAVGLIHGDDYTRSVPLGRATSDAQGYIKLPIPPNF